MTEENMRERTASSADEGQKGNGKKGQAVGTRRTAWCSV